MANLYVAEFSTMGKGNDGFEMQAPIAPPIASQTKSFTTSTAVDTAFTDETTLVMILADAACNVEFGAAPTATSASMALPGEVPMFFSVPRKSGLKVAAVTR